MSSRHLYRSKAVILPYQKRKIDALQKTTIKNMISWYQSLLLWGFTEESEEKIKLLKNVDLVIQDEVVQMLDLTFENLNSLGPSIYDVNHFLIFLTLSSPLSPSFTKKAYGVTSPFDTSSLPLSRWRHLWTPPSRD